jgi:pSer/pThr/pTyr-binding forkhead associated (FHA) protein
MSQKFWQLIPQIEPDTPYRLTKFPIVLGRSEDCEIAIPDKTISPRHARLTERGRKLVIEDLESAHGTLVNDEPIRRAFVRRGAKGVTRLQIGHTVFHVCYGENGKEAALKDGEQNETPPPADWFYRHDEKEIGPVDVKTLLAAVRKGELALHDEVWRNGEDHRRRLFEVRSSIPEFEKGLQVERHSVAASSKGPSVLPTKPSILRNKLTCPYCWSRFDVEDMLAIAAHPDLVGDPMLGEAESMRFLPQHFTHDGHPLDPKKVASRENACPNCHMRLPDALLTLPPVFFSIFGVPSSGKSYFLTSMCWILRGILPKFFKTSFKDADATTNNWLNEYEDRLFLHGDQAHIRQLDKTEMRGHLYREVLLNRVSVSLPLPSFFTLLPGAEKESTQEPRRPGSFVLVVYDNAGEHFQPGQDSELNPGTRHIAFAQQLLFLFDPTKDPRLRAIATGKDYQLKEENLIQRQDVILTEIMDRLRRHLGLKSGERYKKTFVFAVSKADVLSGFIPLETSPWTWSEAANANVLNLAEIAQVSYLTRTLLNERLPDLIGAVESFAEHVIYLPNSALGQSPESRNALLQIKAGEIKPEWVEVPLLYMLARAGLIPAIKTTDSRHPLPDQYEYDGRYITFKQPGTGNPIRLPDTLSGFCLRCPRTGALFRVPDVATQNVMGSPLEMALDL